MPDLDHLDRAFEALTHEFARDHGPGPAAAIATARRHRRTRVGAVALAALVIVGGALTVPRLVAPSDEGVVAHSGGDQGDGASPEELVDVRDMLPEWTGVDLEGALAGWRSPTKRAATTSPNLLCLDDRLNGPSTAVSGGGGSPWGLSYVIAGYDDPTGGPANIELVLDELRTCTSSEVRLETLPNGVHLATYDTGGAEPENAIWLAANGDRAGMVAVERADRPMPASARQDVADALFEILHLPREE